MNFIPIALKFVLVEFVLVETIQVGDPLYWIYPTELDVSNLAPDFIQMKYQ